MAITDKLTYLLGTKAAIKSAIEAKGVIVSEDATFRSFATSIEQITGGGTSITGDYSVKFYDYRGNLVKVQYVDSGNDATPPVLSDPNLTFYEWQGDAYKVVTSDRRCYAIGMTSDCKWHLDIELTPVTGLQPPLCFVNTPDTNSLFIDLGDGSSEVEITATGNVTHTPTYAAYGKYTIKVWKNEGTFCLGHGSETAVCVGGNMQVYRNALIAIRGGDNVSSLENYAFCYCLSLTSITIPFDVISIGNYAFAYCNSIASVAIPDTVTSIGNYAFAYCYSLTSITIPNCVTGIGTCAFCDCFSIKKHMILAATAPTLADAYTYTGINSICHIYVPNASVTVYKTATNWVTYADYIYPISEMEV